MKATTPTLPSEHKDDWQTIETAPDPAQPIEQQPSPPNDPLQGIEYRADGEANFYTLSKPKGNWLARIQFNGELRTLEQENLLEAMLGDRNVRYGNGFYDGYWKARGEAPDVTALVKALEIARDTLDNVRGDINPERGYAEELEEDVSVAYRAVLSALEAMG